MKVGKKREDIFHLIDTVSAMLLIVLVYLKIIQIINISFLAFGPFAFSAIAYCFTSTAPNLYKTKSIAIKCLYAIQVFLVTAKIDEIINCSWSTALLLSYIYLGVMSFYFIAYLLFLLISIPTIIKNCIDESRSNSGKSIGTIWCCAYYGLYTSSLITMLGFSEAYDESDDTELMIIGTCICLLDSVFLTVYTLLYFKNLVQYIQRFVLTGTLPIFPNSPRHNIGQEKIEIEFEVEQKESYFAKLSATFFRPLEKTKGHKDFYLEQDGQAVPIERIQSHEIIEPITTTKRSSVRGSISIQTLLQYKEALDSKLNEQTKREKYDNKESKRSGSPPNPGEITSNLDQSADYKTGRHLLKRHSMSDLNENEIVSETLQKKSGSAESNCYLCCEREANIILMDCGHGGVCYECVIPMIKTKNECMECRAQVEAVHVINPIPKVMNIVKSFETLKVRLVCSYQSDFN